MVIFGPSSGRISPIGLHKPSFSIGMYLDLLEERFVFVFNFSVFVAELGLGDIAVFDPIFSIKSVW